MLLLNKKRNNETVVESHIAILIPKENYIWLKNEKITLISDVCNEQLTNQVTNFSKNKSFL